MAALGLKLRIGLHHSELSARGRTSETGTNVVELSGDVNKQMQYGVRTDSRNPRVLNYLGVREMSLGVVFD